MKKGDWHWEQLGKIVLALVVLVLITLLIYAVKDKIIELLGRLGGI